MEAVTDRDEKNQESNCGWTSFWVREVILEAQVLRDANMSVKALTLQQLIDSSFPWFTKTFVQWRYLTLPVLLPVVMKNEQSTPGTDQHLWQTQLGSGTSFSAQLCFPLCEAP